MLENDYQFVWFVYGVAAAVSIWLVLTGTGWIKQLEIRWLLRALVAALLFTPVKVDPELSYVAPAFIAVLLDAVVISSEAGLERLKPLVASIVAGFILVIIGCQVWRKKQKAAN